MFEALNPWYWAGAAAVSAPIIIHLINRLRYRRVKWAAMEFLLKSQKRNRRKLILQQLLLLMLRCLLIMLVVLLVVRPLWLLGQGGGDAAQLPTFHVVVLDDSLSMQDLEDPAGKPNQTAFREGSRLIAELARKASESTGAHYFTVLRLSNLKTPDMGRPLEQLGDSAPGQQLSEDEVRSLRSKLENLECTYLRLHLLPGLEEAQRYLAKVKAGHKFLHVVSDFRRRDWSEADAEALGRALAETAHPRGGAVQVRLHDMAAPRRTDKLDEAPPAHANLGITNLAARFRSREEQAAAPATGAEPPVRVVTPNIPVYLHATLKNFSEVEKSGLQLRVKIDGVERPEFSRDVKSIAGGEETLVEFALRFGGAEKLGHKQIAVYLEDSDKSDHLPPDNIRYTSVELKKEIPVLLVDGDPASEEGDSYWLRSVYTAKSDFGLQPIRVRPGEVKNRKDLDQFPVIFLLNVPGVGGGAADLEPVGLKALERYVRRGGSLVFFLGPRVNVLSYNEHLYRNGQGLFPAPLVPRPDPNRLSYQYVNEPPDADDLTPKVRFLRTDHPAFDIYQHRPDFLFFLNINCYFKVDPAWQPAGNVNVIARLHNRQPLANYTVRAAELTRKLKADASPSRARLVEYARPIDEWMTFPDTKRARKGPLLEAINQLVNDPDLQAYWAERSRQPLREEIGKLLDDLTAGDPILLESTFGAGKSSGHVVVFLTSAGPTPVEGRDYEWNNWATLMDPESFVPFVPMMLKLHKHLASSARSGGELPVNNQLGVPVEVRLEKERYDAQLQLWHFPEDKKEGVRVADLTAKEEAEEIVAAVLPPKGPGFYALKLNQPPADGSYTPRGPAEERPLTFSVPSRDEGLLGRTSETQLREKLTAALAKPTPERGADALKLTPQEALSFVQSRAWFTRNPLEDADELNRQSESWSDYAWVLVLFFALLLLEQWLAVKLSFHLKDEAR